MNTELITTLRDHREKLAAAAARANDEVATLDALLSELENDACTFDNFAGNGSSSLGFAPFDASDPKEAA